METKTKPPPNHNAIVAKDNSLLGGLAKFELSELRLLAFCLAHYDGRTKENPVATARVEDFQEIFPSMDKKSAYAVVRRAMLGINKKPLELVTEDAVHFFNWFQGYAYKPNRGEFSFHIAPLLEPFLLDLRRSFSQYRLGAVYRFRSAASWKVYEHLARWRTAGRWTVGLDELRTLLGLAGKYPRWSDFEVRVIAPAIREISEYSDIRVEYHQEKRGRRIIGLLFVIDLKKPGDEEVITVDSPEEHLEKRLLALGINAKVATDYASRIAFHGKTDTILAKLPKIVERAEKHPPAQKYVLGAIQAELQQRGLFDDQPPHPRPDHAEALDCWQEKRRAGEVCSVRQRGKAGQRKKCQMCFEKIPVETFGI